MATAPAVIGGTTPSHAPAERGLRPADQVSLRVLGRFELHVDGRRHEVPWQAQRVLGYLAVGGVAQPRATVAGALWGDVSQRRAQANLRNAVWRVRQLSADRGGPAGRGVQCRRAAHEGRPAHWPSRPLEGRKLLPARIGHVSNPHRHRGGSLYQPGNVRVLYTPPPPPPVPPPVPPPPAPDDDMAEIITHWSLGRLGGT